jgi:hypothetical protein
MAEKIRINLLNGQKKSSDEQFLMAPRNWQKCSALVLASIIVLAFLAGQNIITPHPLFMVHNFYVLIYVPSLFIPITFAIIRPKSIKIGIQTFPCYN